MVPRWIGTTSMHDQRPVPRFVQVAPELRTASPTEADRSLREKRPVSLVKSKFYDGHIPS